MKIQSNKKIPTKKRSFLLRAILATMLLLIISGGTIWAMNMHRNKSNDKLNTTVKNTDPNDNFIDSDNDRTNTNEPPEPEPVYVENPLNGEMMLDSLYNERSSYSPIAITINNHTASRPQYGVTSADIVIESLVESGITRFLEIHWSHPADMVGSLRSLRNYALEWTVGYDAILAHDGWALTDDPRTNAAGNVYNFGVRDLATYGAWRDNVDGRVAPHNEFTSTKKLWERAEQLGWNDFDKAHYTSWKFKDDAPLEDRGSVDTIDINFISGYGYGYDVQWKYNKADNLYYRYTAGVQDKDGATGTPVTASTVIVQYAPHMRSGDDKGRIIITTIGTGEAVIFHDGQAFDGTWEKATRTSRTVFKNMNGTSHEMTRGKIWIEVVSPNWGDVLTSTLGHPSGVQTKF